MNELKQILQNYRMGFITPVEFIYQYMDVLRQMGAEKELHQVFNNLNMPLAEFLAGIIEGNNKSIWEFEVEHK